jgi:hypothetical protein
MKKIHLIAPLMIVATIATIMIFSPSKVASQQKLALTGNVIPDEVSQILHNSCAACHDAGGSRMAMSMWNLSEWGKYPAEKQAKKATAMCNAITKGNMPPGSFKRSNPDKIPTASQIEIVCKWANTLNGK